MPLAAPRACVACPGGTSVDDTQHRRSGACDLGPAGQAGHGRCSRWCAACVSSCVVQSRSTTRLSTALHTTHADVDVGVQAKRRTPVQTKPSGQDMQHHGCTTAWEIYDSPHVVNYRCRTFGALRAHGEGNRRSYSIAPASSGLPQASTSAPLRSK